MATECNSPEAWKPLSDPRISRMVRGLTRIFHNPLEVPDATPRAEHAAFTTDKECRQL